MQPLTSSRPCELHKYHRPKPIYTELHHIVPQAWQAAWKPGNITSKVWLPVTVALCRTSHGNVHFLLVELMKAYKANETLSRPLKGESEIARQAMVRFLDAGGSLKLLTDKGLYGEI